MFIAAVLAVAGRSGLGDFIAGLLLGVGIGVLVGPAVRSWLTQREWAEASRRARLTDRVLTRMEEDARRDLHRRLHRHDNRKAGRPWRA
jgi:glucose-6-phosphate-specific signal transduction histidine kinase